MQRADFRGAVVALAAATLALVLVAAPIAAGENADADGWTFEELGDGVFAAVQPDARRFDDSNSLVVIGDREVLVVDAQADVASVEALLDEIARRTDRPVRWVVNTHWHGDHTDGNAVYRRRYGDAVVFVGHHSLLDDVTHRAGGAVADRIAALDAALPAAEKRLEQGVKRDGTALSDAERVDAASRIAAAREWLASHRDFRPHPPTLTYDRRLVLDLGDRPVELLAFRGHTGGDTVVHLPGDFVIASGDLLDDLPYLGHGFPSEALAALEVLRGLAVQHLVPGHGPVRRGHEAALAHLDRVAAFVGALVEQVEAAVVDGKSLDETRASVDLSAHREALAGDDAGRRFFDGVLDDAVERAWLEARSELRRPAGEVIGRALTYHDPQGSWWSSRRLLMVRQERPGKPERRVELRFEPSGFGLRFAEEGEEVTGSLDGDECVAPGAEIGEAARQRFGELDCKALGFWRDYYGYLLAMPLHLVDTGAEVAPFSERRPLGEGSADMVTVRYGPDQPVWDFYFDVETGALVGCRFSSDGTGRDGERLVFEGEIAADGVRLPAMRRWIMAADGEEIGVDSITSLAVTLR